MEPRAESVRLVEFREGGRERLADESRGEDLSRDAVAVRERAVVEKELRHLGHLAARRAKVPRGVRASRGVPGDEHGHGVVPVPDGVPGDGSAVEEVRGAYLLSEGEPGEGGEGSSRDGLEESHDDVEEGWGIVAAEDGARGDLAAAVGLREEVAEGDDGAVFGPEDVGDVHAVVGDGDVEVDEALILGRADQRDDREEADVVRGEARVATRVAVVRLVHQLAVFDHHEAVAVGDALEEVRRARQIRRVEAVRLGGGRPPGCHPGTEAAVRRDAEARRDRRKVIASHEARRRRDQCHEAERAQSHGSPRPRPRDTQ